MLASAIEGAAVGGWGVCVGLGLRGAGQKSDYGDAALEGRRKRLRREAEALRDARRRRQGTGRI